MKIHFPFPIKQVSPCSVEVSTDPNGVPVITIGYHQVVAANMTDADRNKVYAVALAATVKASITVEATNA